MSGKTLVVAITSDWTLYGASDHSEAYNPKYWLQLRLDREPYALFVAHRVPVGVAQKLMDHGTSKQFYSDGYEGAKAAAKYIAKGQAPFYVSDSYNPDAGPYREDEPE